MSVELKIKAKHLALEPAIIRREEQKLLKQAQYHRQNQNSSDENQSMYKFQSLRQHRIFVVRNEARATSLARAFIKNVPYSKIEQKCLDTKYRNVYITSRIVSMIKKYDDRYRRTSLKDSELEKIVDVWYNEESKS